MIPTSPTAEALTRRAFAGVSAYVIAWHGQPVGRVAFREDGGDLRCLLTVAGTHGQSTMPADWLTGADAHTYNEAFRYAERNLRVIAAPDYEADVAHVSRIRATFSGIYTPDYWQAALQSAGYDVWLAL